MKNHYTLNAGEFFTAQELLKQRNELRLAFPLEDEGWDLLAIKPDGARPVKIQVKESRVYPRRGGSWHQVRDGRLHDADVFIFVSYVPTAEGARLKFQPEFLIIPAEELKQLCETKKANKGKYSFYFAKRHGQVVDERDGVREVTRFDSAWNLI